MARVRRSLPRICRSVVVVLALGVSIVACAPLDGSAPPAQAPAAQPGSTAAPQIDAPGQPAPEPFPWEPLEDVRGELGRALAERNWPAIVARTRSAVYVMRYPAGGDMQEMSAGQFSSWLEARWQQRLAVHEARFVAHVPSLEIASTGWGAVPPSGATIYFVYHVNPDSRRWYLDVVQYE